jgi:hypothetical protein
LAAFPPNRAWISVPLTAKRRASNLWNQVIARRCP